MPYVPTLFESAAIEGADHGALFFAGGSHVLRHRREVDTAARTRRGTRIDGGRAGAQAVVELLPVHEEGIAAGDVVGERRRPDDRGAGTGEDVVGDEGGWGAGGDEDEGTAGGPVVHEGVVDDVQLVDGTGEAFGAVGEQGGVFGRARLLRLWPMRAWCESTARTVRRLMRPT